MPTRKPRIKQSEIVERFAARLKEIRRSRGLTQMQLAQRAKVTSSYVGRLETGGIAPGVDLVQRLAEALGTTIHDLLPTSGPADTLAVLQEQARKLFAELIQSADRETLQMVCPLLARLIESPTKSR